MGLDVYLSHCKDRAAAKAAEERADAATTALWEGKTHDLMTDSEKDAILDESKRLYESFGCDDWGRHKTVLQIEQPSQTNPEHLFKIGYFRSSYNGGGINNVFRKIGMPDLYGIMGVTDREYEVNHDWAVCLQNIDEAIAQYQAHLDGPMGKYHVLEIRQHVDCASSANEALKIFEGELARVSAAGFTSYSNAKGEFFLDGMKVHAFIPSNDRFTSMYVIVAEEETDEEDWYLQALKIMRETCEYVLAQEDPQNYYMRWSG